MEPNQTISSELLDLMTQILKDVPNSEQDLLNVLTSYASERNVLLCKCNICGMDEDNRDVALSNAIRTNDFHTLEHILLKRVDHNKLSKHYLDLFYNNGSIEKPIQEYIQLQMTNYAFESNASQNNAPKAPAVVLNFQNCVDNLLNEITFMFTNNQVEDLWLLHAAHQLSLIAPCHNKYDANWKQYIYIVHHWIELAMKDIAYFSSPLTNQLQKFTKYVMDRRDKEDVAEELKQAYYCKREHYSLKRMQKYLKIVQDINCRDRIGQLAFLRALQVIGECVKNTPESLNMSDETLATLLTGETVKHITDCRNYLSHCMSLSHIDISLLENIKTKLKPLQKNIRNKLRLCQEESKIEKIDISYYLRELCKQLKMALNEKDRQILPTDLLRKILEGVLLKDFRADQKLVAAVTILILCIFERMKDKENNRQNNFWILEKFPILIGRHLRNYFAHTGWFQLLPIDETAALYYYAQILLKPDNERFEQILNPPDEKEWKKTYAENKLNLSKLEKLWADIQENNIFEVESVIKSNSSLLLARRLTDQRHALHFAAIGGENMVVIVAENTKMLSLAGLADRYGYTALHIAAQSGNCETVKALRINCPTISAEQQSHDECKTALHLAVETEKIDVVREILEFPNNGINFKAQNGFQAIHMAVCQNAVDIVKLLFEKSMATSIDDIVTFEGHTCLYLASQNNHLNVLNYLLEINSDVNKFSKDDGPLHIAALNNYSSVMQKLVNYGAHLNTIDKDIKPNIKMTIDDFKRKNAEEYSDHDALWKALQHKNTKEVLQYVNQNKIKWRMCSPSDGKSAIHFAVEGSNDKCLRLIIDKCNINAQNYKKETALHAAAASNNIDAANLLIEKKADIEIYDINGFKAVHVAIKCGYLDMTNILVKAHTDVRKLKDIRTKQNRTCLHVACEYKQATIAEELLKIAGDNVQNSNLLLVAAQSGSHDLVDLLLNHGVNVNVKGKDGDTALHLVAKQNNLKICKLLIKRGVFAQAQNNAKKTAVEVAKDNGHDEIVKYLEDLKQDELEKILPKIKADDLMSVKNYFHGKKYLLELIRLEDSKTLLHFAIENHLKKMIYYFYHQAQSLLDIADSQKQTVLHKAAMSKCDKDCRNKCIFGLVFKWWLNQAKEKSNINSNHKSVNKRMHSLDLHGKSALDYAVISRNTHAVEVLLAQLALETNPKYKENVFIQVVRTTFSHFDSSIMRLLTSHHGHIDRKLASDGSTFLHLASKFMCSHTPADECDCSQFKAFEFLIDFLHANVNAQTIYKLNPLHIAARKGNIAMVKKLIANGADVNALADFKVSALHLAARYNHTDVARILVENAANTNEVNRKSNTPIYYAIRNCNAVIVGILIEKGAYVKSEYRDLKMSAEIERSLKEKETAPYLRIFWDAIEDGKLPPVSELLKSNSFSCTATCSESGRNALHFAAGARSLRVFAYLCKFKQLQNVYHNTDMQGRTLLHIAADAGNLEIVDYVLQNGLSVNVNDQDNEGWTAMHFAAASGRADIIQKLFNKFANCSIDDNLGKLPLHHSAQQGHTATAHLLIQHGANIDACDTNMNTPLHLAATNGHIDVIKLLIQENANIEANYNTKSTPLLCAASIGNPSVVNCLIECGADIHAVDTATNTALHLASLYGHSSVAKLLIQRGLTTNIRDKHKNTPLHHAVKSKNIKMVDCLLQCKANVDAIDDFRRTPLHLAAKQGTADIINLLIDRGANIEASDRKNKTPLHFAVESGHASATKCLIQQGANTQARTETQSTPLHLAASHQDTDVMEMLFQHDININIEPRDNTNKTPLHIASLNGHANAVRLLIQRGANVEANDERMRTPFDLAESNGYTEVTNLLKN